MAQTRVSVAVLAAVTTLGIGFVAISQQAQLVEPETDTALGNSSYNITTGVLEGVSGATAQGAVWFGVGAIVLAAVGLLVVAANGVGGR
jgi:hypothetical protein